MCKKDMSDENKRKCLQLFLINKVIYNKHVIWMQMRGVSIFLIILHESNISHFNGFGKFACLLKNS